MLVVYCQLCHHYRNLAEGGRLLLRFHFTCCHHFSGHVTCQNLPWQGLSQAFLLLALFWCQRAEKVVSNSPGLVDFAIGLVKSVLNLPDGQVMFFEEFE